LAPTGGGRTPTIAFAIRYTGRNPRTVADVANMLASVYVVENSKIREGQAVRTAEFLKTQLDAVKKELDAQERRATEFNLSHIGELPQQVAANLASLERLNTQLRLNGENQVRAMDRRERFERQLAEVPATLPAASAAEPARAPVSEELAKLRQQLEQLRRKYTDRYPEVIRMRAEIADAEKQLSERPIVVSTAAKPAGPPALSTDPRTRLVQAIADTDVELNALKNEEASFRHAISSYEQRVENVPKRQEEFEALSRDSASTKERYDTLLKRYEEAQLASSLEQGQKVEQFRILDAAIPPREPAAPSRARLFAIGFFLAAALAVGSVLLMEKLDTAFHSIDDLRAFVTVPALFSIPLIPTITEARRKRRRMALAAVSVVVGLAVVFTGSRYLASNNEQLARFTADGRG
jgi:polysaccharide chain length determinant protein (PEP-CTERM system associated)